jgi:hypothetical protein
MSKHYSFAEQAHQAELLLAGLSAHADRVAGRGVNTAFITELNAKYDNLLEAYNNQQALKARLMEKTAERIDVQDRVFDLCSEARKLVKIEFPQESWVEFGITAEK